MRDTGQLKMIGGIAIGCWLMGVSVATGQTIRQDKTSERLDAIASSYTTNNAFMGTVLVSEGQHTLLDKGYGLANVEWSIPNAPKAKFRLGSLTKQFTAALILLLEEDGKLKITDPVSKYLPGTPKAWDTITLANLLSHTSGIPDFIGDPTFRTWSLSEHTIGEELAYFEGKPLQFQPGTKFSYSNSNYEVLGAVIEQVTGKPYGEILRARILSPLSMVDSGLDTDTTLLPKRAQGYWLDNSGLHPARSGSMSVPWAAGGMYSTTHDLLIWENALFGGKVLTAAFLKKMITPGPDGYGLGVEVYRKDDLVVVAHQGGIEGFDTSLIYVPSRRIAIVVLSNVNGNAPREMSAQLLDAVLGKPVVLLSERRAVAISPEALKRFEGVYDLNLGFALTIASNDSHLTEQGRGAAKPLEYEGIRSGHPFFYIPGEQYEIEFVPGADNEIKSLIVHRDGDHPGTKRVP